MGRRRVEDGRPDDTWWRDGKLTFRRRWPASVVKKHPELANRFFQKALGTSDVKAARPLAAACLIEYHKRCQELMSVKAPETADAWLASLTDEQRAQVVAIADARTAKTFGPSEDAEEALNRISIDFFQSAWAATHPPPMAPLASALLTDEAKASLQEAFRSAIQAAVGDDAHLLSKLGYPRQEMPASVREAIDALESAARPKTLTDALALRTRDLKDDRYKDQIEWALRLFHGIVGEKPLTELRALHLSDFETALRRMPSGTTVRNAILSGTLTARDAVASSTEKTETLSRTTVAKHVGFIRSLTALAFGKGLAGDKPDPFASFRGDRVKKSRERKHFLPDELDKLFAEMTKRWVKDTPDRVWISLLALFHGLRREEVCQLLKSDIRETAGVWCLHITTTIDDDDADDAEELKRLKTENAIRVIPIHRRVLEAGFLTYVNASPGPRIFASLTQDTDGRWGGNFGKRFGELKGKAGVRGRRTLVFHSFRHTAISAMRDAEWPHAIQLAISGHAATGSANDGYGAAASPNVTKPYLDKLAYRADGLDGILKALSSRGVPKAQAAE